MMTVTASASLVTPPKNDAAPISANAPGSIHAQYPKSSLCTPNIFVISSPTIRPYRPPTNLKQITNTIHEVYRLQQRFRIRC